MLSLIFAAGVGALAGEASVPPPPAQWETIVEYPAEGLVSFNRKTLEIARERRSVDARVDFHAARRGEVAKILMRLEMDCSARSFRTASAAGFDRDGARLYSTDLSNRPFSPASGGGPMARLLQRLC